MCGRYRCSIKIGDLIEEYNINVDEWNIDVFSPKDQIYPTQYSPILFNNEENSIVRTMHWGLIPYWAKDKKYASKMINARSETLLEKPSFKNLINHNFCNKRLQFGPIVYRLGHVVFILERGVRFP